MQPLIGNGESWQKTIEGESITLSCALYQQSYMLKKYWSIVENGIMMNKLWFVWWPSSTALIGNYKKKEESGKRISTCIWLRKQTPLDSWTQVLQPICLKDQNSKLTCHCDGSHLKQKVTTTIVSDFYMLSWKHNLAKVEL